MIDSIPPKAVLRAIDAEQRMLEDDLVRKRTSPDQDTLSILSFCDFLESVRGGSPVCFPSSLPVEHCAFYRRLVQMLEEAGEIPVGSREHFDAIFLPAFLNAFNAV